MELERSIRVPDNLAEFILTIGFYSCCQLHAGQQARNEAARREQTIQRVNHLQLVKD